MIKAILTIKKAYNFLRFLVRYIPYKLRHNHISSKVYIEKNVYIRESELGDYSYIGFRTYLNHVKMGKYCSIAADVIIGAMEHSYWEYSMSTFLTDKGYDDRTTTIGNDIWIGTNCVVRQGIKIGDGAVIGANSFVNKDIPPYTIAFGSPVKIYKMRFTQETINLLQNSKYWDYPPSKAKKVLNNIHNQ